ncbi:MAG: hypothetical protein EOM80_08755 [Erysipelotrichia bacterium]|nr:hypothetical protein [Erysipelotrichia bacterium]
MKNILTGIFIAFVVLGSPAFAAGSTEAVDVEKTPWLKGVEISPYPVDLSPVLPLKIYLENGEPVPATVTEDIPLTVVAETSIFDPEPIAEYKGQPIPNPRWEDNPAVSWFVIDWEKNKNFMATVQEPLAINQMVVVPTTPTGKGAITCHIARRMRYDLSEPGTSKATFANSSGAKDVRVLDITPPLCGLEISVKGGGNGAFWPVENPPNKYPLPKQADVYLSGAIFNAAEKDILVSGIELGKNMIIAPEQGVITLSAKDEISIKVIGGDNYKLDNSKLRFGICDGAGGEPAPIVPENTDVIKLSKIRLPKAPYIYLDATDTTGNRQLMFVPLKIK